MTSTKTKTTKTKKEEPTMTVEEMRAALDGEEKMVTLILSKAQVDDFNVKARELGQPTITVADLA